MASKPHLKRKRVPSGEWVSVLKDFARHDADDQSAHSLDTVHIKPEDLRTRIQEAVNNALSPEVRKYSAVRCLLVSWETDNLGCDKEIAELSTLFQDKYGFTCESFQIPDVDSEHQLLVKLNSFHKTMKKSELFILYYSGHASKPKNEDCFYWSASDGHDSPTLDWFELQGSVEKMRSDALLILDCCYAAHVVRGRMPGRKEVLAATGWDNTAVAGIDSKTSFTAFLIRQLEQFALSGKCFAIKDLYAELIRNAAKPSWNRRLKKTPLHVPLKCEESSREIVLYPLSAVTSNRSTSKQTQNEYKPQIHKFPRMTAAVSFKNGFENCSAEAISRWLTTNLPPQVSDICVDVKMAEDSNSTLAILTFPMAIWTALSDHPAIRPCGIIIGSNSTPPVAEANQCIVTLQDFVQRWKAVNEILKDDEEDVSVESGPEPPSSITDPGNMGMRPIRSSLFQRYCRENDTEAIVHLINKVANLDEKDEDGLTGLLHAAEGGHWDLVILLVRLGADVNVQCNGHDTALCAATRAGRRDVVKLMVDHEANINSKSEKGVDGVYALHIASMLGDAKMLKLLLEHDVDIDAIGETCGTALKIASENGHRELVQLLLESGADCNLPKKSNITALYAASRKGHTEIVALLLKHGAIVNAHGEACFGTALDTALLHGHAETARLLREHGAKTVDS